MEVLHVVYASTLVGAEHVVLLRSLSSVPPASLATFRYRASSMCFVQIDHCLCTFIRSSCFATTDRGAEERRSRDNYSNRGSTRTGALALLQLFGCNTSWEAKLAPFA